MALAGGCTRSRDTSAAPTLPPETSVVTSAPATTAPPDVGTIPAVIDEDYLNRVLAALDQIDSRATQIIIDEKWLVPEAADLIAAIYDGEAFSEQTEVWLESLARDPELRNFKRPTGSRLTRVARIISRSPACVWTEVSRDYTQVAIAAPPPKREYIALKTLAPTARERAANPTAWIISYEGYLSDGSEPEDPCTGS